MSLPRALVLFAMLFGVCAISPNETLAAPSVKRVRDDAREAEKIMAKVLKNFKRLSPANRAKVVAALSKSKNDSDLDGVADILELSVKARCKSDSDDDGLDDGDEYRNGTKPNDRDSDDDGRDDGEDDDGNGDGSSDSAEIEVKGRLMAKSPSEITVGTTVFVLTGSTRYRQGSVTSGLSIESFALNSCVEVEGRRAGATITASKVKSDNDCF